MLKILVYILSLFWISFAHPETGATAAVEAVLTKYRKAPAVTSKIKKTVVQEVIGSRSESQGTFYFSKGKLRLEITEPEKTTLVYDGKNVWLESRLEDVVSVTKIRTGELKKSDSLLAALFERREALAAFKLLSKKADESGSIGYSFEPKDKKRTEVQSLELNVKKDELARLSYRDQVENQVIFEFEKMVTGPVSAAKFSYQPPKGASVTEIK